MNMEGDWLSLNYTDKEGHVNFIFTSQVDDDKPPPVDLDQGKGNRQTMWCTKITKFFKPRIIEKYNIEIQSAVSLVRSPHLTSLRLDAQ